MSFSLPLRRGEKKGEREKRGENKWRKGTEGTEKHRQNNLVIRPLPRLLQGLDASTSIVYMQSDKS